MNFQEMQEELSEVLAESSTRTFTLTQRRRWINRGVVEVCRLTRCLVREATADLVAGDNDYHIMNDWNLTGFMEFAKEGIVVRDAAAPPATLFVPLERRTVEWLDEVHPGWRMTQIRGMPQYYAVIGQVVYLYPTPNVSVTGGVRVTYYYYPVKNGVAGGLVDPTDVPFDGHPALEPYHMLPVLYAGWRGLLKVGAPKAEAVLQEFVAGVETLKRSLRSKPDYEPRIRMWQYRAR